MSSLYCLLSHHTLVKDEYVWWTFFIFYATINTSDKFPQIVLKNCQTSINISYIAMKLGRFTSKLTNFRQSLLNCADEVGFIWDKFKPFLQKLSVYISRFRYNSSSLIYPNQNFRFVLSQNYVTLALMQKTLIKIGIIHNHIEPFRQEFGTFFVWLIRTKNTSTTVMNWLIIN